MGNSTHKDILENIESCVVFCVIRIAHVSKDGPNFNVKFCKSNGKRTVNAS